MVDAGLHIDMTAETYHSDPCPEPSLSASIAKIMVEQSPRHAWTAHPRLNPAGVEEDDGSARLDLGSVAHELVLGKGAGFSVLPDTVKDFRTNAAKDLRDKARAAGLIPILKPAYDQACDMADELSKQMRHFEGFEDAFTDGHSEAVMIWREQYIWCRAMVDRLQPAASRIFDYKTVSGSVHPSAVGRRLFDMGYDLQAAWYERGAYRLELAPEGKLRFFFVAQEIDPPYLVSVVEMDQAAMMIGRKKVAAALDLWGRCVDTNTWPGYPREVARIEMPPWVENRWLEREMAMDLFRDGGMDPFLALSPWSPPPPPRPILPAV